MTKTIGNPLSWLADAAIGAGRTATDAAEALRGKSTVQPEVTQLTMNDLRQALRNGIDDFAALRSDVIFLIAIYPIVGTLLAVMAFRLAGLPLLFPLAAGFALLGPVVATGLYEMSRRREISDDANWGSALGALKAYVIGPVLALGFYLMVLFIAWMFAAKFIYQITLGPGTPTSVAGFLSDVFMTGPGWAMIVLGVGTGFVFAAAVLVMSLISFPMLIDRRVGLPVAVLTSVAVTRKNTGIVAIWGLIVAFALLIGMLPAFLGLVIVLPVLGHATWHLYRAAVPIES